MQDKELGDSGLRAPQLGFGCSALLGRSGRAESLRALAAAWDEGIRFFDTARSYGYGEAESLLGEFLVGRWDQAVIATKFGILATSQSGWKKVARSVARGVLAIAPSARPMLRRGVASQFSLNHFSVPVLRQSIEESLRKLRIDCVDLLFLHGASGSVLEQDDLLEAMGRLVEAGKVKIAGLSAEPDVVELAMQRQVRPLRALQFPRNVFNLPNTDFAQQDSGKYVMVANHPYGGVARVQRCREILRGLVEGQRLDPVLCEKLGDVEDSVFADVVLNAILRDSVIDVVVPAMMRVEHIRANVRAVMDSRFDSHEVAEIRRALAAAGDMRG